MLTKKQKLDKAIKEGKTILGIGPMSWNCIEAVVEVANEERIPMQLIASRRQVEAKELGGGYVTDTETFAEEVRMQDKGEFVFIARDHGGPWQGANEESLSHKDAMFNAEMSYLCDIESGFNILHIDPSLRSRPIDEILADVKSLHKFCQHVINRQILYECGTEEHSGQISDVASFERFVREIKGLTGMKFVVGNMGYWVKELENVGKFDEKQAKEFVRICNENDLYLKGHNSDYLTGPQLDKYNKLGVHSINIAPELGTRETEMLLWKLEVERKARLRSKFIKLAVDSGKWEKWMKDPSEESPDLYKAKICGHYIMNTDEVRRIKRKLPCVDETLKESLKAQIKIILQAMGWEVSWK